MAGSNNAVAIDAASNAVIGTVSFDGKPELAVADEKGHVFVNLEDKSSVGGSLMQPRSRWSTPGRSLPARNPPALPWTGVTGRIFSACANNLMIVLDADSGRVVAQLPIGSGVDGAGFDPSTRYAFSSNGEGTLTVVREDSPVKFSVAENVATSGERAPWFLTKRHTKFTWSRRHSARRRRPPPIIRGPGLPSNPGVSRFTFFGR